MITKSHLKTFKLIVDVYKPYTKFPEKDRWRNMTNNDLWFWMVSQVLVVGGSASSKKFWAYELLKKQISFSALRKLKGEEALQVRIHQTLRKIGARWAAKELQDCLKTKALVSNFMFFKQRKSTPKELLEELSRINGKDKELKRVAVLKERLSFFKNKSARDFLMNLGMNQHTLAIDIRTQNIFHHFGIPFPDAKQLAKAGVYEETEYEMQEKLCRPLKLLPVRFDRILYQQYPRILKSDYYQLKLPFAASEKKL